MLCTSGFVDDVMFLYHGANEPKSSTTLCLEGVRQVAVSVGTSDKIQSLVEFVRM